MFYSPKRRVRPKATRLKPVSELVEDLDDLTCADGTATLTDRETKTFVQSNRSDELYIDFHVVTRHDHLDALGQGDLTGHIQSTDEELGTILVVERSVATTFFLLQNIDLAEEVGVRLDGAGLGDNFTTLDFLLVDTTEEETYIVTCFALVEELAEHLDTGNDGSLGTIVETDDLSGIIHVNGTSLDTSGNHGATAGDGEDILDRHEERLLVLTNGQRDIGINSVHELEDFLLPLRLSVESTKCGATDDGSVVTVEVVLAEEVADFHLNEVKHFLVVNKVDLVQEHNHLRNVHLLCEKHVLVGLGHGTVSSGNHEDCTVHLGSTSNHVLHVIGVTRAVDMRIVTICGLVLDVSGVDGDTTLLLFGSVVNLVERLDLGEALLCQNLGNSSGKSSLAVVNMADSADVYVGFVPFECFFCHNIMC